jgi:hypothetical protein
MLRAVGAFRVPAKDLVAGLLGLRTGLLCLAKDDRLNNNGKRQPQPQKQVLRFAKDDKYKRED